MSAANESPAEAPRRAGREGLVVQAEVHDRHQVELRFNYPLGAAGRWHYLVDVYLFLPRSLGISPGSYSRDEFYSDFTAYMRIDALPLPLDALADRDNPVSPLHRFATVLDALHSSAPLPSTANVRVHVKLYANLFAAGVRAECRKLEKTLSRRSRKAGQRRSLLPPGQSLPPEEDANQEYLRELESALDRMREGLWAFRRIRAGFWPFERLVHRSLAGAMRVADEYMSLVLEERLAGLSRALGAHPDRFDGTGFVVAAQLRVAALGHEEALYRARYGYLTLDQDTLAAPLDARTQAHAVGNAGEYFTYRASTLKKNVQQALYLAIRGSRGDTFVRNAVAAVGAALAAIWALAAQVPTQIAGLPARTQFLVFGAAVLAYVLKDRIKANTGEFLMKRLKLYDHDSNVYGETLPELGIERFQARIREVVRFSQWDHLSDEIRAIRLERRTIQHTEQTPEEVLHYHKRLDVGADDDGPTVPEGYRLRDLLRINVRQFLGRLDEPNDTVDWYDLGRGTFVRGALPKVYHVNVVIKVRQASDEGAMVQERNTHLRVVLNKDGIVRAEEVRAHGSNRVREPR